MDGKRAAKFKRCASLIRWFAVLSLSLSGNQPASLIIDYPLSGSVFPPEFPPPTFLYRDATPGVNRWAVTVSFATGSPPFQTVTTGEPWRPGEIDPRATAPTNQPPSLPQERQGTRTWRPQPAAWSVIKTRSGYRPFTVTIAGYRDANPGAPVSRGTVSMQFSKDPVNAPIFYRDVPLMPSETEKGVIKPLASEALPLIAWRIRDVAKARSRVVMEGLHTCANCHSLSRDGKTLGLDVDGPQNEKGLYALVTVRPQTIIRNEDMITWSTFRGKLGGKLRVGFMSQVSPDGRYVITMINDPGADQSEYERRKSLREVALNFFVANFKDYRFLQVFYPTRGILAWYSRETGRLEPLPGADDPRYVHTNAVWTPDGKYLIFARAEARNPYHPSGVMAAFANDPRETQIRYDLYRIPFNGGKGGTPEPITGASHNGMSNSFPKVSPDGRWIVFVQARNGLLMRPDSQLYIVPFEGGVARRMRCNTPLMNSWHSFSPNGRWMVFSSKSLSPYTQMFLTHIDEQGHDTPPVLVENATAANRAVNLPEFINIAPDGLLKIDAPVTEYYRLVDLASSLAKKGNFAAAANEWAKALRLNPSEAFAHNNLGVALVQTGRIEEAVAHYQKALELSPEYPEAHNNLGEVLTRMGKLSEAITHFETAVSLKPAYASAHANLGAALMQQGKSEEAFLHLRKAVEYRPDDPDVRNNLAVALAMVGRYREAIPHLEEAVKLSRGGDALILDLLAQMYAETGRWSDALRTARLALAAAERDNNFRLMGALKVRIESYESQVKR